MFNTLYAHILYTMYRAYARDGVSGWRALDAGGVVLGHTRNRVIMLSIIGIGKSVMLLEIGHDFYIGDSVVFIGVERKTSVYIYLDFIVYDSTTINNMKLYYTLGFDMRRETTSVFPIALFYLPAYAFALFSITFDICLFLSNLRELFFLLFLRPF
jgi:hypothetical protein